MQASNDALHSALEQDPHTANAMIAARDLVHTGMCEHLRGDPITCRDQRLHSFLRLKLLNRSEERMMAIFLDCADLYIHSEVLSRGGRFNYVLRMRELFHRALDLEASGLIIAHNHPSGSHVPSKDDLRATRRLATVAESLDVRLIDHLIVSKKGIFSLQAGRLI